MQPATQRLSGKQPASAWQRSVESQQRSLSHFEHPVPAAGAQVCGSRMTAALDGGAPSPAATAPHAEAHAPFAPAVAQLATPSNALAPVASSAAPHALAQASLGPSPALGQRKAQSTAAAHPGSERQVESAPAQTGSTQAKHALSAYAAPASTAPAPASLLDELHAASKKASASPRPHCGPARTRETSASVEAQGKVERRGARFIASAYQTGLVAVVMSAIPLGGCRATTDARAQVVLVVDTDLPVSGQLAARPELSPDAAIDTVRVDVLAANGAVLDSQVFVVPNADQWPLSFGVPRDDGAPAPTALRVRGFRGRKAVATTVRGVASLQPPVGRTVDRVVGFSFEDGVVYRGVVLRGACLGIAPSFGASPTGCVDADRPAAPATDGVAALDGADMGASLAGTWEPAVEVACVGATPAGATCIAGGFSVLGDVDLAGSELADDLVASPERPARLSPYFLDLTEVTVGAYRALVATGAVAGSPPTAHAAGDAEPCAWLGATDGANDALPLNCVSFDTAAAICAARGGSLPTEAQWEHAARGRGEGRSFPWGEAVPTCCTALLSRAISGDLGQQCGGPALDAAGSHGPGRGCVPDADVSRDGVLDLGGSLSEWVLGAPLPYAAPCWTFTTVPTDPLCADDSGHTYRVDRGGAWTTGLGRAASALRERTPATAQRSNGVRCAYRDAP